jgi:hypothetical protein
MTIIRWTSPERAAKMITKHNSTGPAGKYNEELRRQQWIGHIGLPNVIEPSCGCLTCTTARFNMKV